MARHSIGHTLLNFLRFLCIDGMNDGMHGIISREPGQVSTAHADAHPLTKTDAETDVKLNSEANYQQTRGKYASLIAVGVFAAPS